MTVSWRHMVATAGFGLVAASGIPTASGQQCCPSCCTPPRNIVVNVPGVSVATPSVSVGASSASVAVAGAAATTMSSGIVVGGASSGGSMIIGGGGGGYYAGGATAASTITGLNVDGGYEKKIVEEEVSTTEDYCIDKVRDEMMTRPIQAVCIDDKNNPHPASRLYDETLVDGKFRGEIYRCMQGTHMAVTLGSMTEGKANFDKGESFSCRKGDALWHGPGGTVECRPQAPERNCNERSLLRRFGPGIKLVSVKTQTPYCEPAQRTKVTKVQKEVKVQRTLPAGNLVLDGGVGNGY
jgi:hypothetical protein